MQTTTWHNYGDVYGYGGHHSISGTLKVIKDVHSPQLNNHRHLIIYLPPSYYESGKRYPVLYMHDGQNLFDNATSYVGEWQVDETMQTLSYHEQLEAIVVGIPNMEAKRIDEYSPFRGRQGGGQGNAYLDFIVNTIKPLIDHNFRTKPDKKYTGLMGSSMGGLITLYGFFSHQHVFGFAGVMSPSIWFANQAILHYVEEEALFNDGKIYLDVGTREYGGSRVNKAHRNQSRKHYAHVRRLKRLLVKKGYRPTKNLIHVEEKWASHTESAWARRLPGAIRFFLNEVKTP